MTPASLGSLLSFSNDHLFSADFPLGTICSGFFQLGAICCRGFRSACIHTLAFFHVDIVIIYACSIFASQGHLSCLAAGLLAATTLVLHLVCFKRIPAFHQEKKIDLIKN